MFKRILSASFVLLALQAFASEEVEVEKRACPNVHVFGARETTVPPGYGSSSTVVNLVLQAYPGSTSEAINYPACGGQSSCGGVSYANSVIQGVSAVASAVNTFNQQCPDTQLVLVGYSQVSSISLTSSVCHNQEHRVVKSWTTLSVVEVIPTKASLQQRFPYLRLHRARLLLPSSWVTLASSMVFLTKSAPAKRKA